MHHIPYISQAISVSVKTLTLSVLALASFLLQGRVGNAKTMGGDGIYSHKFATIPTYTVDSGNHVELLTPVLFGGDRVVNGFATIDLKSLILN